MKPPPDRLATTLPSEETPHRSGVGRTKSDGKLESAPVHDDFKRFQSMSVPLELRKDWLEANAPEQLSKSQPKLRVPEPSPPVDVPSQTSILPPRNPNQLLPYDPDESPTTTRRAVRLQNKGRPWLWLFAAALTLTVTALVLLLAPVVPEQEQQPNEPTPIMGDHPPALQQNLVGAPQQQQEAQAPVRNEPQVIPTTNESEKNGVQSNEKSGESASATLEAKTDTAQAVLSKAPPTQPSDAGKAKPKTSAIKPKKTAGLDTKTPFAIDY